MRKNFLTKRLISAVCSAAMLVSCVPAFTAAAENDETLYVLSGNNFTDADKALYSGKTLVIPDTGAEYKWSSDSDTNFKIGDKYDSVSGLNSLISNKQMVGGTIKSNDGKRVLWTDWNSNNFSTAQFDLKGIYDINAVDVWSLAKKGSDNNGALYYLLGDIEIYAGTDKQNMQKVWSGNASISIAENIDTYFADASEKYEQTSAAFDTVQARYVNIKIKRRPNFIKDDVTYRVPNGIAAEMVIFGTLAGGEQETAVKKVQAKAADYLAMRDYYTADSVDSLETALENLNEADAEIAAVFIQGVEDAIENLVPSKTHYTLSGNKWDDSSKAAYTSWGETLASDLADNAPSYAWNSKSDADIIKDTSNSLTSGRFVNTNKSFYSVWNAQTPSLAYYDLGAKYVVDRVDVIQQIEVTSGTQKSYQRMGKVSVLVSEDGTNYVNVAEGAGNNDNPVYSGDNTHSFAKTTLSFAPKSARYIAIETQKQRDKIQYTLAQTAIFGYETKTVALDRAKTDAQKYLDFASCYTDESIQALRTAVNAANFLTDENTETEINAARVQITDAIDKLVLLNGRRIFSGNSLTDDEKTLYTGWDSGISTDLVQNTPTYNVLSDAEAIKTHNANSTMLVNGKLRDPNTYMSTAWNTANEIVVEWDLGTNAVIDRVDTFMPLLSDTATGSITISVSENGTDYTEAGQTVISDEDDYTLVSSQDNGTKNAIFASVKFAPAKARYVKAVLARSGAAGIRKCALTEMVIFGISADNGALANEVSKYSDKKLEDLKSILTDESYQNLTAAITSAKAVLDDALKTQTEIDAELAALKNVSSNLKYVSAEGILTCNLKTDADKALYEGYDNLYTGLSYAIDGEINSNADANTVLTDGDIENERVGNDNKLIWGAYYGKEISIVVDAGQEVYFTGADLYEAIDNSAQGIGNLSISLSDDGVEYTEVWSGTSDVAATDTRALNKLGGNFMAQKGRYLKFTSTPRKYQQIFAEIVVKGFKAADVDDVLLAAFADTTYTIFDTDMLPAENIAGADMIMANGNVINESETALAGYVFTAVYSDGRLISAAKSSKIELSANGEAKWSTVLENLGGLPENARLVNYFWSNMEPIAEKQEK